MTPEQLEAHRVRFEQQYTSCVNLTPEQIKSERREGSYTSLYPSISWQAYQWALSDAGRAQRAAPGVQDDAIDAACYRWLRDKALGFDQIGSSTPYVVRGQSMDTLDGERLDAAVRRAMGVAAQETQQSAQPVAELMRLVDEFARLKVDRASWGVVSDANTNAARTAIETFARAAQPVEAENGWEKGLDIRMSQGWKLKGGICPVLYTDTVNGYGVGRDDLWLATTEALKSAQPVEAQRVRLSESIVREKARLHVQSGHPYRGHWCANTEPAMQVLELVFRSGFRSAEAAHGIKPTSSEGGT